MVLKYEDQVAGRGTPLRKLAAVAFFAGGIAVLGGYVAAKNKGGSPVQASVERVSRKTAMAETIRSEVVAARQGRCEDVFTGTVQRVIEERVGAAVNNQAVEIKKRLGSSEESVVLNISVAAGRDGRPLIEDIWVHGKEGLNAREIVDMDGLGLDNIRIAEPAPDTACTFSFSERLPSKRI